MSALSGGVGMLYSPPVKFFGEVFSMAGSRTQSLPAAPIVIQNGNSIVLKLAGSLVAVAVASASLGMWAGSGASKSDVDDVSVDLIEHEGIDGHPVMDERVRGLSNEFRELKVEVKYGFQKQEASLHASEKRLLEAIDKKGN